MTMLPASWNDPLLAEKAEPFFLACYRKARANALARQAERAERTSDGTDHNGVTFCLNADNLPEDFLELPQYEYLTSVLNQANRTFEDLPPESVDARAAALILIRRTLLDITKKLINRLFLFLMMDERFNPSNPIQVDAIGVFDFSGVDAHDREQLASLLFFAALYNHIWRPTPANADFSDELATLHCVWDVFFDTAQIVFPIQAVAKCRRALTLLFADFGKPCGHNQVPNFIRRRKTMSREIAKWRSHGGQIKDKQVRDGTDKIAAQLGRLEQKAEGLANAVNDNTSALVANTKAVANMDRRQKNFLALLRKAFGGFIKLFRPAAKPPTREQVAAMLASERRYACLDHLTEPRQSQIKAVIDQTAKHPIAFGEKKRDVYTLAHAVRDVWRKNEEDWPHIPGAYETFEALKSACYDLQKKKNDPFTYQT